MIKFAWNLAPIRTFLQHFVRCNNYFTELFKEEPTYTKDPTQQGKQKFTIWPALYVCIKL